MKVLVVEDERDISNALVKLLKMNNYSCDAAYDGEEALDYLAYDEYDAVILDIMMPKKNGIEVLKEIRSNNNNVPVLMLTAKSELDDKVKGLDSGADDYLTKPFSFKELLARIRAITRRKTANIKTLSFLDVVLDNKTFELKSGEKAIRLGSKEYQIMELLITSPNNVITSESLIEKVWGFDSDAEVNVVWVHISTLRKKIHEISDKVTITVVRGIGYKLQEVE